MGIAWFMKRIIPVLLLGVPAFASFGWALTPKQIYRKAGPAVVFIFARDGSGKGSGGTGSVIRRDGLVLTNAHILKMKPAKKFLTHITVYLKPERITGNRESDLAGSYRARIVAADNSLDLALLKIDRPPPILKIIDFADSDEVVVGDHVFAIGHPEQGGLWSLTTGVISTFRVNQGGVKGKNLFQTDASINRGNSGGPLLNENGDMVGINAMIARKAADGMTITDVNFSIRSDVAIRWLGEKGYRFTPVKVAAGDSVAQEVAPPVTAAPMPENKKRISTFPGPDGRREPSRLPEPGTDNLESSEAQGAESADDAQRPEAAKPAHDPMKKADEHHKRDSIVLTPESQGSEKPRNSDAAPEKRILTEKRPYDMDELIEDMREMEDLMEEMRDFMDDFKKRN